MEESKKSLNFIEQEIEKDLASNKNDGRIALRFPPEPNGYLHIGHAKSICLNFGLAAKYNGTCNLRFDDTNPDKETPEYVDSIKTDVKWLGFSWDGEELYTSDYFDKLYEFAQSLIKKGLAYVDDQTPEEIANTKGTPTISGTFSPYRDRSPEENITLFEGMKNGEFPEGSKVLRAKIDMANSNMHMRDPLMYRIKKAHHHRTGNRWNIYPMYDFAHGQSDSIEEITYSLCTLEFEVHRPLYNWFIEALEIFPSRQIEFARLNLSYTVLSKRKLLKLVEGNFVESWDDPRMPTISGMRRRGYTPLAIREFATKVGIAKRDGIIDIALLEHSVRNHLNKIAERRMAVLNPLKLIITNYEEGEEEWLPAVNNPEYESAGSREIPFSRELYIDREDFMIDPPSKFFRLGPGKEVRLKYAYFVTCTDYKVDDNGIVIEIHCTYDPQTKSRMTVERKVKGTLGWVSAKHAINHEIRMYDRLFTQEDMGSVDDYLEYLNPDSLEINTIAKLEPSLAEVEPGKPIQFERIGYFVVDDKITDRKVFNRTVTLRDNWSKKN